MNVLYIDHYAGSDTLGMEFRPYDLAKLWKDHGVKTTILAGDYSHLRQQNPEPVKGLERVKIDDISFLLLHTSKYDGNGFMRIKSMTDFVNKGRFYANKILRQARPHVIICSSTYPMDTYLGKLLADKAGVPLIHEIHDLWPMSPMELGGYSEKHPFIKMVQKAEIDAYRNADLIVSILPNASEHVEDLGIDTPVVNIPNGVKKEQYEEGDPLIIDQIHSLQDRGKVVIGYAGGLSVSNAMGDLIEAAELLRNENYAFIIIGDGIEREKLQQMVFDKDLYNVYFFLPIKKSKMHNTLKEMDALYIGSKRTDLYHYGVSANKIFDYMQTGKPIINAFYSAHSPLVYAGTALTANAGDPMTIASAIRGVSRLSDVQKNRIFHKQKTYIEEHHDLETLAKRFLDEMNTLIAKKA